MPFLTICSNGTQNDANLAAEAAKLVGEMLHKPLNYVVADIRINPNMAFEGSTAKKGALIELKSIGFSDKAALARALTDLAAERLQLERRYINVRFVNLAADDVAVGGSLLG